VPSRERHRLSIFFDINEQIYLVDLPGYGYAGASKVKRREWGEFIVNYLRDRDKLALILHLIDLRHEPMKMTWRLRNG